MRIAALSIILSILSSCSPAKQEDTNAQTKLSAKEFYTRISSLPDVQLVDVRTPEEYRKGHIENAANVNINGDQFKDQIRALDKDKPVYVYCLSGARSANAAAYLRSQGYSEVYEMPGGILEWRNENLPEITLETRESGGMRLADYQALVTTDKLALVDFYATWCAPCKKMEPYLDEISKDMQETVEVIRINADEHPDLLKELGIVALPVLKLYQANELIWEHSGFIEENEVRAKLN